MTTHAGTYPLQQGCFCLVTTNSQHCPRTSQRPLGHQHCMLRSVLRRELAAPLRLT